MAKISLVFSSIPFNIWPVKDLNPSAGPSLRVPLEIASIIRRGEFPAETSNPLVMFEFIDGQESLFDTRKGLFLNKPKGIQLPGRETLKAFGRVIQSFRRQIKKVPSSRLEGLASMESFAVCS
jgi:hypothetical protein